MRRIINRNPLRGTVSRFITRQEQRDLRQRGLWGKGKKQKPKVKRSAFVKFMNRLENKGPQGPSSIHVRWTSAIKANMEKDGVWPEGEVDWDIEILARYLQELQRQFWNSVPTLVKKKLLPKNCASYPYGLVDDIKIILKTKRLLSDTFADTVQEIRTLIKTFNRIHKVIRDKGLRDRTFIMSRGNHGIKFTRVYIDAYPIDASTRINVWFNEGCSIISYDHNRKVTPILVMPHLLKRVDVHHSSPDRDGRTKNDKNVFVF